MTYISISISSSSFSDSSMVCQLDRFDWSPSSSMVCQLDRFDWSPSDSSMVCQLDRFDWLIDWSHWWWPSFRFIDCLSIGSIWLIDWLVDWSHRWWTLSFQFIDGIDIRNPRRKTTFKSRKSIWNKNMILSS